MSDPWISADWNRYADVRNNTVRFFDPTGRTPIRQGQSELDRCVWSEQLQSVDVSVRHDICEMIPELESAGYFLDLADEEHITGGYREQKSPIALARLGTSFMT